MVGSGRVDGVFIKDEGFQTFVVSSLKETIIIRLSSSLFSPLLQDLEDCDLH